MFRFTVLMLCLVTTGLVRADEVQVAVAANFAAPMKDIVARFEQQTGHKVRSTVGATGKFYAQIHNGAPFEILLAADDDTPARLEKEGAGVAGSRFTYAIGKLVLWSARSGVVDEKGAVLNQPGFAHLSIANPKLAPYGAAAVEAMKKLNVYGVIEAKLVVGESIAQAHQFVASGAAPLGFVAMSQVFEGGKLKSGSAWVVPDTLYSPIRQDAIALDKGRGKPAVDAFLNYLKSDAAKVIIRSYGYAL
ncbi:molybdate ABC transporter substrate-binding protein [Massilia sp. DWR3-1-1]|uniref:molybdate ABC transporter substrate-binding protein n=1 Tax=Massilia sp. DWR3-1-1 TaxID=2804559 RepID=UPI003CEF13F9